MAHVVKPRRGIVREVYDRILVAIHQEHGSAIGIESVKNGSAIAKNAERSPGRCLAWQPARVVKLMRAVEGAAATQKNCMDARIDCTGDPCNERSHRIAD